MKRCPFCGKEVGPLIVCKHCGREILGWRPRRHVLTERTRAMLEERVAEADRWEDRRIFIWIGLGIVGLVALSLLLTALAWLLSK